MSEEKVAVLNITKALMGVSFAVLAAIGSATGNIWIAGLTAVPAAGLTASDTIGSMLAKLKVKKEELLELPTPPWWTRATSDWEGICAEIEKHLPAIMQKMATRLQQEQGVVTAQVVRKTFIDVVGDEPLTWEFDPQERRHIAEYIATPLLQKEAAVLKTVIEPIRADTALTDTHTTAANTEKIVEVLEKAINVLEKIQKQGEQSAPASQPIVANTTTTISTPQGGTISQTTPSSTNLLHQKIEKDAYDVFICYNRADRSEAMKLGKQLKDHGILPWLDSWKPGGSIEEQQRQQIAKINSAAVFVGKSGIATLQQMLADAFLRQFVQRGISLIPVFLEDAPKEPLPIFLDGFGWVDFREKEPEPMGQLIWGITGKRPSF
jgi:hypothetical protein